MPAPIALRFASDGIDRTKGTQMPGLAGDCASVGLKLFRSRGGRCETLFERVIHREAKKGV